MPFSFNPFSGNFDNTPSTDKGDSAYTTLCSTSATWVTYTKLHEGFFPLSGGIITGPTKHFDNVTIFGDLSCTGTQTFANTIFTTTSSISVVHFGSGPALWVGNNGDGDIASFNDIDAGIEVLHVGGITGDFPNVGVKTGAPNKDFTVNGEISAKSVIWDGQGNSTNWNSVYSNVQSNSANFVSVYSSVASTSGSWDSVYSSVKNVSGSWDSVYSSYQQASASYASQDFVLAGFLPLSGGTLNGPISSTSSASFNSLIIDGDGGNSILFVSPSSVGINTDLPNQALTVVGNISSNSVIYSNDSNSNDWNSAYTTVLANSGTWSSVKRFDYVSDGFDYSYSGVAPEGTIEIDPFWKITRLIFSDTGSLSATGVALNVTWNERLTATYV